MSVPSRQCSVHAQLGSSLDYKLIGYIPFGSDYSMKHRATALYREWGGGGHLIVKIKDSIILRRFSLDSPWLNYSYPVR